MTTLEEEITQRLQALEPCKLILIDDSHHHIGHAHNTGGGHFRLEIASSHFVGKSLIIRHRLIYTLLADLIPQRIHALRIQAECPVVVS